MRGTRFVAGVGIALVAWPAFAHDLGVDVDGTASVATTDAPRVGSAGVTASGAYDFGEALSLFGAFSYHRELATRVEDVAAGGGDIFQLGLGALWLGESGLSALLGVQFSPASTIRSAAPLRFRNPTTGLTELMPGVAANTTTSLGFTLGGGLATATSLLSASLTASRYELGQRFEVPATMRGQRLAAACVASPAVKPCPLVNGKTEALWQVRAGLSYTLTLGRFALGAEGAAYFFDSDPAAIGFFSVAVLERSADAGSGASAAFLVTVKPYAGVTLGRVALRLGYQLGAYAAGQGLGHQLSLRTTVTVTDAMRLTLTLSGQADTGGVTAYGAGALVGATWIF